MTDSPTETVKELLELSQRLLESIDRQDWSTYTELCAEDLTAFEPEAAGHLVAGLDFHRFYLDPFYLDRSQTAGIETGRKTGAAGKPPRQQSTISSPHVRLLGDVAVVCYVRLVQRDSVEGMHRTHTFEETRIWQRQKGGWRHVHFHRSPAGRSDV